MFEPKESDNNNQEEEESVQSKPMKPYQVGLARHFNVYLSEQIGDANQYIDVLNLLRTATAQDLVTIYINSVGGQVGTGIQLISAMKDCQATVRTVLDGCAFSMAGIIFLAGDERIAKDNSILMLHNYSAGIYGKGHELFQDVVNSKTWFQNILKSHCAPFLSVSEIDRVIRGEDLYFLSDDINERLKRVEKKTAKKDSKK